METNYPGGAQAVADRYGNHKYDAAEPHQNVFDNKMKVQGWDGETTIRVSNWDPHNYLNAGQGVPAVDAWFRVNYGGLNVAGVGIESSRWSNQGEWMNWNATEYTTYGGGGIIDPQADDFYTGWTFNLANESYGLFTGFSNGPTVTIASGCYLTHRSFGAVYDEDTETFSTDGAGGNVEHTGWNYDSPREFDDLPSSIYHMPGYYLSGQVPEGLLLEAYVQQRAQELGLPTVSGTGDGRLGEVTGPQSDNINGADQGINNPQFAQDEDDIVEMAGPLAFNIHGDNGWDAGSVMALELVTWTNQGGDNIDMVNDTFINRDINLDGMVDQGYSPPAGFYNYTLGRGLAGGDGDGQAEDEGYPFNRGRFFEDVIESLDYFLDFDKFSESERIVDYLVPTFGPGVPGGFGGPSGLWVFPLTLDDDSYFGVNGFPHNDALGGDLISHEMSHDKWGTQDLYDYDVWNGIQESFPIGAFDRMATGGWTKTPISKILIGHEDGPFAETRDLREFLLPGEAQTIEMLPVDYEQNEKQYYWFGRGKDIGYELGPEGFFFYYDSGVSDYTMGFTGIQIVHQDQGVNSEAGFLQQRQGSHFQFEMVEADASGKMRDGFSNGDVNSVFNDKAMQGRSTFKKTFNMEEFPKSAWWDGDDSGIEITDIDVPSDPDEFTVAKVTFLWKPQLVPNLTFRDPPGGQSVGNQYAVKINAWDRFGESKIYMYHDLDDEGYDGSYATGWTSIDKEISGDLPLSDTISLAGIPNGALYFYAFIDPTDTTVSDEGDEPLVYELPRLKIGDKGSLVATPGPLAFGLNLGIGPHLSSLQRYSVSCNYAGVTGEATFIVEGDETGLEPALLTAGVSYTTQNDYSGNHTFLVTPGPEEVYSGEIYFDPPGTSANVTGVGTAFLSEISANTSIVSMGRNYAISGGPSSNDNLLLTAIPDLTLTGTVTASLNSQFLFGYDSLFAKEIGIGDNIWFNGVSYEVEEVNNFAFSGIPDLVTLETPTGYDGILKLSSNILSISGVSVYENESDYENGMNALGTAIVTSGSNVITTSVNMSGNGGIWISGEQYNVDFAFADNLQLDEDIKKLHDGFSSFFHGGSFNEEQAFGLGDQFFVYTTGLTPYSEAILVNDNKVVEDDPNAVEVVTSPVTGPVSEGGTEATFGVKLNTRPTADVVVNLVVDPLMADEITIEPTQIIFTPDIDNDVAYWKFQTITVTGLDDEDSDGDQTIEINFQTVSDDPDYENLQDITPINVVNADDETYGIDVITTSLEVFESDICSVDNSPILSCSDNFIIVEGQGEDSFGANVMVELAFTPDTDVVVSVSSSSTTEGDFFEFPTKKLFFEKDNLVNPQYVQISGYEDDLADGDQSISISFLATSDDVRFDEFEYDLPILSQDRTLLVESSDNIIKESGQDEELLFKLGRAPTDDVTVTLSFPGSELADLDMTSLTFTTANWSTNQLVTVSANIVAGSNLGNRRVSLSANLSSNDTYYDGYMADFPILWVENFSVNILTDFEVVDEGSGNVQYDTDTYHALRADYFKTTCLGFGSNVVTEANRLTSYGDNIVLTLTDEPTADVKIYFESTDLSEGNVIGFDVSGNIVDVSGNSISQSGSIGGNYITFTNANWNVPQVLVVAGTDDDLEDGDQTFEIDMTMLSADGNFNGGVASVEFVNVDDEGDGCVDRETVVRVRLKSLPSRNVRLFLSTTDLSEAIVTNSPAYLDFGTDNWGSFQEVTVSGIDDFSRDGDIDFNLRFNFDSDDNNYNLLQRNIAMTNIDDDVSSLVVSPISNDLYESGKSAHFDVRLSQPPLGDVKVSLNADPVGVVTLEIQELIFNEGNYNIPQTVMVHPLSDDDEDDSDAVIVFSPLDSPADEEYDGFQAESLIVTVIDDDNVGVTVSEISNPTDETGEDLENGVDDDVGRSATFYVHLQTQPSGNNTTVVLDIQSSDITEGTVSPTSLTFTSDDWKGRRVVTVTGVDDGLEDGNIPYQIYVDMNTNLTTDPAYFIIDPEDVDVVNYDNEFANIVLDPVDLVTDELGGQGLFRVHLTKEPTSTVSIVSTSSDTGEGRFSSSAGGSLNVTATQSLVEFDETDYSIPKLVYINGVPDGIDDGNISYVVSHEVSSSDGNYDEKFIDNLNFVNLDSSLPYVVVSDPSGQLTESGGSVTFTIRLLKEPTAEVYIDMAVTDDTEASFSSTSEVSTDRVTFNANNYSSAQKVTVYGISDSGLFDGAAPVTVQLTVNDESSTEYVGSPIKEITLFNLDEDSPGINVNATQFITSETGDSAEFWVSLFTKPSSIVKINMEASDSNEASLDKTRLVFLSTTWEIPQRVVVTGLDGADVSDIDGDRPYEISFSVDTTDADYSSAYIENLKYTNLDNDSPKINFFDALGTEESLSSDNIFSFEGLETSEAGGNVVFYVNLQVADNLVLTLSSGDPSEGNIITQGVSGNTVNLVMDGSNYTGEMVVIQGLDDEEEDGPREFTIDISVNQDLTPSDSNYAFETIENMVITNQDDDDPDVTFSSIAGQADESGNTSTFTARLNSIPEENVRILFISADTDEIILQEDFLDFNSKAEQTVTLIGVDDLYDDGTQSVNILMQIITNDDGYKSKTLESIVVTNEDDGDTAGYTVVLSDDEVAEGAAVTVSVNLHSQPFEDVTIEFTRTSVQSGVEDKVEEVSSLTFTPLDWDTPQTTNVQTIDDGKVSGDYPFNIRGNTVSDDAVYSALAEQSSLITIDEDDSIGIDIYTAGENLVDESGKGVVLGIRLNSEPNGVGNIILDITPSDSSEVVADRSQLVFDETDWSALKYVKVNGVGDSPLADGDQMVYVTASVNSDSQTTDGTYKVVPSANVDLINMDLDSPGLVFYDLESEIGEDDGSGSFSSFRIGLLAAPTSEANVIVTFTDFDVNNEYASANIEISQRTLSFDATDYKSGKIVTIKSLDGVDIDADEDFTITVQAVEDLVSGNLINSNYASGNTEVLEYTMIDLDAPALLVTTDGRVTSELGQRVRVDVSLRAKPTETVIVNLAVDRSKEASLTADSLTFTTLNYATTQSFYVAGLSDSDVDGTIEYTLRIEAFEGGYDGQVETLNFTNVDADSASVRIGEISKASTAEWGSVSSVILELSKAPTRTVSVDVVIPDDTEGEPVSQTVTFDLLPNGVYTANVFIQGVDDDIEDGHQNYRVTFENLVSEDDAFNGLPVGEFTLINFDEESSGIGVNFPGDTSDVRTKEYNWGGVDSVSDVSLADEVKLSSNVFSINLLSTPSFGNVVLNLVSEDTTEGVIKGSSQLVFTPANYDTPQQVEIVGRDDDDSDGDKSYSVSVSIDESTSDLFYQSFPDRGIKVINEDVLVEVESNIPGGNTVLDLAELNDRSVTFDVSGGRPNYSWTLEDSPLGNDLGFLDGSLVDYTSGTLDETLKITFGLTSGLYQFSVKDDQITPDVTEFEIYVRGAPMVTGFKRPSKFVLELAFEDVSITDRTGYKVYHSQDGENWQELDILDGPYEGSALDKPRGNASANPFGVLISFPQADQAQAVGYFRIDAVTMDGDEVPEAPTKAILNATPIFLPSENPAADGGVIGVDVGDNSAFPISIGGGATSAGGGGGGGGCLLAL